MGIYPFRFIFLLNDAENIDYIFTEYTKNGLNQKQLSYNYKKNVHIQVMDSDSPQAILHFKWLNCLPRKRLQETILINCQTK